MRGVVSEAENGPFKLQTLYYLCLWLLLCRLLCPLQGSITDDKSKATHHIYPSPSQQDEGTVEMSVSI